MLSTKSEFLPPSILPTSRSIGKHFSMKNWTSSASLWNGQVTTTYNSDEGDLQKKI